MSSAKSAVNANATQRRSGKPTESPREITHDVVQYVTDYARDNPGYAALWCVGVGFVLGWKLKPW